MPIGKIRFIDAVIFVNSAAHTLPPKSLHTPISVYAIKHACYSGLGEGQGEGQHLCKLGAFLRKL